MTRRLIYQRPERWEMFEVTARTTHGRYLLHPGEECGRRLLGVIGKALQHYGDAIRLHLLAGTSNHIHLLLTSLDSESRADFKAFVMSNTSKELGLLYDWPQHLWGRRSQEIPVLDSRASRERGIYFLAHGRKEGLLPEGEPWPGLHWVRAVTEGYTLVGTWYNRTDFGEEHRKWDRRKPQNKGKEPKVTEFAERIPITLHPLPYMEFAGMSAEQQQAEWKQMLEYGKRRYPTPASLLGLEALQGQHPHTRPRHSKKSCAPWAHFRDKAAWIQWKNDYKEYVTAYRDTSERIATRIEEEHGEFTYPAGGVRPVRLPRWRRERAPERNAGDRPEVRPPCHRDEDDSGPARARAA